MSVDDNEVYYDIDTFDEDELIKQQQEQAANGDQDTIMSEPSASEEKDTAINMDVDENAEEDTKKPIKEKKKKEKKEQPKKEVAAVETTAEESTAEETTATEEAKEPKEKKLSKKEKQTLKAAEYKAKREAIKAEKAALKEPEEPKVAFNPMEGVDISKSLRFSFETSSRQRG